MVRSFTEQMFSIGDIGIRSRGRMQTYPDLLSILSDTFSSSGQLPDEDSRDLFEIWSSSGDENPDRFFSISYLGMSHSGRYPLFGVIAEPKHPLARLLVIAGHHGEEAAGPMAAIRILDDLSPFSRMPTLDDALSCVAVAVMPCIEPEGYDWGVKRFSENGRGSYWRPTKNQADDINGTWGARYWRRRLPEIDLAEAFMRRFLCPGGEQTCALPSYVIDLHETVVSAEDHQVPATIAGTSLLAGAGPLLIESCKDTSLGMAMISHLCAYGIEPFPYNVRVKISESISVLPQVEFFAPGRSRVGPMIRGAKALVCTDYAHKVLGAEGITIETFLKPLDRRVAEHMILVEGALGYIAAKARGSHSKGG